MRLLCPPTCINEWLIVIEIVMQVKMFTNDFIKLLYKLFGNMTLNTFSKEIDIIGLTVEFFYFFDTLNEIISTHMNK